MGEYGIEKGDCVVILMCNYLEWVQGFMVVILIGVVVVCMNVLWMSEEMQYGFEDSGVKVLIVDQECIDCMVVMFGCVDGC